MKRTASSALTKPAVKSDFAAIEILERPSFQKDFTGTVSAAKEAMRFSFAFHLSRLALFVSSSKNF